MTPGQVRIKHSRLSQASRCQVPAPMKWRVAAGCHPGTLTSNAPLISSTSSTGAPAPWAAPPPPPPSRRVSSVLQVCSGASPMPPLPPPAKPATPTVWSSPLPTDCLALTLAPYLDSVLHGAARRTSTYQTRILKRPRDSPGARGLPVPLPGWVAQRPPRDWALCDPQGTAPGH